VIDLGLWDARAGDAAWSEAQFRGWGGSSHPDVAVTPQGLLGHANHHASARYIDHRAGPVYELAGDGSLTLLRAARAPSSRRSTTPAGSCSRTTSPGPDLRLEAAGDEGGCGIMGAPDAIGSSSRRPATTPRRPDPWP
jgi:hypothetical protein